MLHNLCVESGNVAMEMNRCCQLREWEQIILLSKQSNLPCRPKSDSAQSQLRL